MRYDKKIWFCNEGEKVYNKETGNYIVGEETTECRYGSVTGTNDSVATIIYGKLIEGSCTIQIQQRYDERFSFIRIGEQNSAEYQKRYEVDTFRLFRNKEVFIVHEVQ